MTVELLPLLGVDNPYPGLRPFEAHEAFLFHGRQDHTRALLERLSSERFLAVVGSSGSGKSSLVRAGLLPALYRGYLVGASSRWRIAVMRPGNAPLDELAGALASQALRTDRAALRQAIGRTSLGLVTSIQNARLDTDENVLIVVDQFEELFRFERERRHQDGGAEASLFVQSLIQAADTYGARLFVVITMRSDFLGRCAEFPGLPEALNRGQYLIPHLTREQRREAIEKPPLVANARIKPALAQQLLNDMGDDPGQLPVLQHALMRTFRRLRETGGGELEFDHYARAGGLAHALDQHADSIVESLQPGPRGRVEGIFRALTTTQGGRAVRRPATLHRIFEVLAAADDKGARADIVAAIEAFAEPENSLLVSSTGLPIREESVIDISHESLIKNWRNLTQWALEEMRSAEWFLSLVGDTARFTVGDASPWSGAKLDRVTEVRAENGWNEAWAKQYLPQATPSYADVMTFLEAGVRRQQEERAAREAHRKKEIDDAKTLASSEARAKRAYMWVAGLAAALVLVTSWGGYIAYRRQQDRAVRSQQAAQASQQDAAAAQGQLSTVRIEQLTAQVQAIQYELRDLDGQLARTRTAGKDDGALRKRIADLETTLANVTTARDNAQRQLGQAVQASTGSDHAQELQLIKNLQADNEKLRKERDGLKSDLDTYAGVQIGEAREWKSRAEKAEAQVQRLESLVGRERLERPDTVVTVLPEYSNDRLDEAPFNGRVHLFFGNPVRSKSPVGTLYVLIAARGSGPPEFQANPKAAAQLHGDWFARAKCPGYQAERGQVTWCFSVEMDANAKVQQLGSFTYARGAYRIVATTTPRGSYGGSGAMTVVIAPTSAPASTASKRQKP
jgi:hypothetical protein